MIKGFVIPAMINCEMAPCANKATHNLITTYDQFGMMSVIKICDAHADRAKRNETETIRLSEIKH